MPVAGDLDRNLASRDDRIVEAYRGGGSLSSVGKAFGITAGRVQQILAARNVARNPPGRNRLIAVPSWVPSHLIAHFRDVAHRDGEEAAASECRRLKHAQVA